METKNREQIIAEIQQLCSQYLNEVPSRRRTWPKSIKERVFQLLQLELSTEQIAKETGIPVATIYAWKSSQLKPPEIGFMPLEVVPEKSPSLKEQPKTPRRGPYRNKKASPTIIVVAPSGIRFEGLDGTTIRYEIQKPFSVLMGFKKNQEWCTRHFSVTTPRASALGSRPRLDIHPA